MRHLMLVPSSGCPAHCAYCFGPRAGGSVMRREVVEACIDWQNASGDGEQVDITFHGGEPLTAGLAFFQTALPLLRGGLSAPSVHFSIQSNLWQLTNEFCSLFQEYRLSISTSLDGPQAINDAQRGAGYYQRTMRGIQLARAYGLQPGVICTCTAQSAPCAAEIFDFFLHQGLSFNLHAALPALRKPGDGWALSPQAYGELLVDMLERYLPNSSRIRISTLDAMCRSISAGKSGLCTFSDCLGEYLAVDPQGWIYPCQRMIGFESFRLGNVMDLPTRETLQAAPGWKLLQQRQESIQEECGDCPHVNYCRGGCPYNVMVANEGRMTGALRDPYCPAYRRAFDWFTGRALEEVFSEENLAAVVASPPGKHDLLHRGSLLRIMRGGPHPQEAAMQARRTVAAVALAAQESLEEATAALESAGAITNRQAALQSLVALQSQLHTQKQEQANAYLHVTYACNLSCDHCYAFAGPQLAGETMPVQQVEFLVREAARAGFQKAVITGGEPLAHPQRAMLLERLAALRPAVRPLKIVLRTNLASHLPPDLLEMLPASADQIVVSLDGDEATHDARRGPGAYARTLANLQELIRIKHHTQITLAATFSATQVRGAEGEAVRRLGEELGVETRFKPILPLGRAAGQALVPEFYSSLDDDRDDWVSRARLTRTCGLGMNLYTDPSGTCFPCYALTDTQHNLGNVFSVGLAQILARNNAYRQVTVDSNRQCSRCGWRYLCGGFCRAWAVSSDPDSQPQDCSALQERARVLLKSALAELDISPGRWQAAGLPLA